MNIDSMRQAATQAGALLRALGNEDRLLLLCQLSQREMSVGELAQTLGIRQPTLSQQLSVLRQEGLASTRREGKQIYYAVSDEKALTILSTLYQLYCPAPGATL
ncbi:regulatory protein ArsR [Serratia sp. AS12]|uniref:ArsR/SmtB family transcription factor n=1 Tax=Serratia TaxID=613 RepID=UPI00020E958D|nr:MULTISPECIES: metalloregulator ArsR/SmtB family transcription factor [Serratia]AEF44951.1 regulatory protein ArsR [Serratia plymuthica AS9]AEF49903.1 regulatory protein ArsR [Serratia sp. AS12]AEG27610.1 regulatory protein ArsR [Serratia sp. AS13]UTN98444.1 metalloregulator ArsR/SmtB family transcription factor [Serratia plymuthica]